MARLGDIATVITKGTTPTSIGFNFQNTGVNFIKIESITEDGMFLPERFGHIDSVCNKALKRSQLQKNDILFSIAGAIGRTAIVNESILPANTNQALAIIRIPEGVINYKFLLYALQAPSIKKQFEKQKQGVAQLNISLKDISDFIVPMLSIHEQEHTVAALDSVNHIISLRKQQLAKLDELVKARFVEMFGDPIRNSMQWDTYPLEECLERIDNGRSFVCSDKPRTDNNPAILKLSAATYGDYRPRENKALLDKSLFVESAEVHAGDLLFTRKNTPELVGMAAYVQDTPSKLMMPDLIFRLVPNEKVNAVFLWQLINCKEFRPVIQAISGGSAKSMSNISKERLGRIKVICPPRELQDSLIPFVKQTDKSKLTIQQSLAKMEMLKQALMQEYFGKGV